MQSRAPKAQRTKTLSRERRGRQKDCASKSFRATSRLEHHGESVEFVALPDAATVMFSSCHKDKWQQVFWVLCVVFHCCGFSRFQFSQQFSFLCWLLHRPLSVQQFDLAPLSNPSPFVVARSLFLGLSRWCFQCCCASVMRREIDQIVACAVIAATIGKPGT